MKTRVLVVEDSAFVRMVICDILSASDKIEVVGTARNGNEAIEKAEKLKPDVITMDVEMPQLDGISALKIIMKKMPTPVLMISNYTAPGASTTISSLENGAVDFIPKPASMYNFNTNDFKNELIEKIKLISTGRINLNRLKQIESVEYTRMVGKSKSVVTDKKKSDLKSASKPAENIKLKKIIAIGTSTGGPKALQSIIPNLPKDIEASVLIVQHMPAGFTKSMAERLNQLSNISVKEAVNGELLKAGCAYVAPGGKQMRISRVGSDYKVNVEDDEPVSGHKPSVDAMMYSVANTGMKNAVGVILTGMGSDGTLGLAEMKKKNNAFIIAQDEESCIVYGMPKAAVEKGVVDKITGLDNIAGEIIKAMEV